MRPTKRDPSMKIASTCTLAFLLTALLSACAGLYGPAQLQAVTTSFAAPSYRPGGRLAIIAADARLKSSLEFAHFRQLIADKFAANGYMPVDDVATAGQVAIVSYGVDNQRTQLVSYPLYGQVGGGMVYSSGVVSHGASVETYSGTTYVMPQFGLIGETSESVTTYSRVLAIDLIDGPSFRDRHPQKLLEIRTRSEGCSGNIVAVFPALLAATFAQFPGDLGVPRRNQVVAPLEARC